MLALVNTPNGNAPVELRQVQEKILLAWTLMSIIVLLAMMRLEADEGEKSNAPACTGNRSHHRSRNGFRHCLYARRYYRGRTSW